MSPLFLGLGGVAAYLLFGKKKPPQYPTTGAAPGTVATPSNAPSVPERMATVLASKDPNAIRFEAGRLRQEGYGAQSDQLEKEAQQLDAEIAAKSRPAPVYPKTPAPAPAPPPVVAHPAPAPAPPVVYVPAPLPPVVPPVVVLPSLPPVAVPTVVVPPPPSSPPSTPPVAVPTLPPVATPSGAPSLPLPTLGKGEYLEYVKPPAPYDPRVVLWQQKLVSLGISIGADGVDGKFGKDTQAATKAFQTLANKQGGGSTLTVDGVVGPQTLARAATVHPA